MKEFQAPCLSLCQVGLRWRVRRSNWLSPIAKLVLNRILLAKFSKFTDCIFSTCVSVTQERKRQPLHGMRFDLNPKFVVIITPKLLYLRSHVVPQELEPTVRQMTS